MDILFLLWYRTKVFLIILVVTAVCRIGTERNVTMSEFEKRVVSICLVCLLCMCVAACGVKKDPMEKIKDCVNCGHCKSKCPYGLDTPALLKKNYEDYKTFL